MRSILQIYVRGARSRFHASGPGGTMIRPCSERCLCWQSVGGSEKNRFVGDEMRMQIEDWQSYCRCSK